MSFQDHYATLGVAPDAEDVVIAAAYRALAQRYHPDKSSGGREAHTKMAALNDAYAVLSDAKKRVEYDRTYAQYANQKFETQDDTDQAEAFSAAMKEMDERWVIASSVYPDIVRMRARLNQFSTPLAFAFVATLLERKDFENRSMIQQSLEHQYLVKYFGSSQKIIEYARKLILGGRRDAARALNRLVEVIGSPNDPQPLIDKIENDYDLFRFWQTRATEDRTSAREHELKSAVKNFGYFDRAVDLAKLRGYVVQEIGGGIFSSAKVKISADGEPPRVFVDSQAFIRWAQESLCEDV